MEYNKNPQKIRKIENNIFILNKYSLNDYKLANPSILIIIFSQSKYSHRFAKAIINGKIKSNVSKIITSDSVIVKYINNMRDKFRKLFPNCKDIRINSLENKFNLISRIIDGLDIIENVEYEINDYIFNNGLSYNYKYFTNSFFIGNLLNIKYVRIIKNITIEPNCSVEKNIILNIIDFDYIEKNNNSIKDIIIKYNISEKFTNNIYLEYIDKQKNISFNTIVVNMIDIDFLI